MTNDIFGIKKLYPSSTSSPKEFVLPMHNSQLQSGNFANSIISTDISLMTFSDSSGVINYWEAETIEDDDDPRTGANVTLYLTVPGQAENFDLDCDLDYGDADNNGKSGMTDSEWLNTETTFHFWNDGIRSPNNHLFVGARAGLQYGSTSDICCGGYGYSAQIYTHPTDTEFKGKVQLSKMEWYKSIVALQKTSNNGVAPDHYQQWIGIKFVVYNQIVNGQKRVKLELYMSPSDLPGDSQTWVLLNSTTDYEGRNWSTGGAECGGVRDQPITWASPFGVLGWLGLDIVRFKNLSIREIDPNGTFGEDPEPPPVEEPEPPDTDPGEPPLVCPAGKHEENGICVLDNPDIPPVDVPPPATISTLTKRLTIRREIINSSLCSCDGIPTGNVTPPPNPPGGGGGGNPPPGGGGSGGGGGSNTLPTIYNVLKTDSFVKLASVDGSDDYYLRYGQGITQTNSPLIGAYVARIQITIAEKADPRGGTGAGVHCRIRKGTDDSIAATFLPVALEGDILNAGKLCVFDNLDNEYALVYGDKILFEYDGGDRDNYIKIFRSKDAPNNGTKTVWQDNEMDAGEYDDDADWDICMRVYKKESIINPQHDEDDP